MHGAILAIDQGTSGTKAVVVDPAEGVVGEAECPVTVRHPAPGAVEVDPQDLLRSVLDSGRQAVARSGRTVAGVALANQGETVLAWNPRTGRPLTPAIVWQDRRAESVTAGLADVRELIEHRTGLQLDPYFSAPKQAWIRRELTREGVVTTSDSWLIHQLTGMFVTDVSTASRSLIIDLDRVRWDAELLAAFGLDGEALPRIADCDEVIGTSTAFGPELPVGGLIVDQQAALLGEGCLRAGEAKCTFGTGAFLLANTGQVARRSTTGLTASVAWRLRGTTSYCLDGQVYAAASAVNWLQQLGLIAGPGELDTRAEPDADGVLCVPALAGLAAPWWRSQATASLSGMTLATRTGHVITAVLQGIAAQVSALADATAGDLGAPLTRLRVDGGLVRSVRLMQAVADIAQLPVDVYPYEQATALGAAAAGRLALDRTLRPAESVPGWQPRASFEPAWSADRAADFRHRWGRLAASDHEAAET